MNWAKRRVTGAKPPTKEYLIYDLLIANAGVYCGATPLFYCWPYQPYQKIIMK